MNHITTIENIKNGSFRFISDKIDNKRIEVYIEESEELDIKPKIGDALFTDIIEFINQVPVFARTFSAEFGGGDNYPDYNILLNGGIYEALYCGVKTKRSFKGLIYALNYYVWARIVKNNNYTVTRFGVVNKNETYSDNAVLKERLVLEKDALSIADIYMNGCIQYLKGNASTFTLFERGKQKNRLNFRVIGE